MIRTNFGTYDGNVWEEHCQVLLKLKYESSGYQEIVAHTAGDYGIEGYTRDGIVFQCYCPDEEYPPKKLYEVQRDKVTADLKKLHKNKNELKKFLGSTKIKQWIFLTPLITNKELIAHCKAKAIEWRANSDMKELLDENFDVLVQDEGFFASELLIAKQILKEKLDIYLEDTDEQEIIKWKESQSQSLQTLYQKLNHLFEGMPNQEQSTNKYMDLIITDHIMGGKLIYKLQESFPLLFEKHFRIKNAVERKLQKQVLINALPPNKFLEQTMDGFESALKSEGLDNIMSFTTSNILIDEAIADWLIRCPLDFGGR